MFLTQTMSLSNRVKLTPVFCSCSQIITLSTQSVTYWAHDGEWQFQTKQRYAQASQIQSRALSAVSVLLLHLILLMSLFNHLCSLPCCPHRRDTHHRALRSLLFLLLAAFSCNEGEFLDMQSQQCRKCAAGTYSLGTGIAFDEWDRLPSGFVTQGVNTNGEDVQTDCSKSVYVSELR